MKKFLKSKIGIAVIVAVIVIVLAVAWYFGRGSWIPPLLVAVLVIGVLWIGIELFLRAKKRRRQKRFDEGVAAREGIEDRKREWGGWVDELEKQGIDRYDLPFYLLLGEPQSGKSVLLQNSDLHFPFGQTRLSGVGGTRGCDWWFTEEAVILDLAGRLFTHEGGAADEIEWGAFLDLLVDFRPMCPANGILLVIPCDGLLQDQRDAAAHKAIKIQNALLTLTSKLQAQLPVYLVLTKGDKVFGFAECVHRLDAPKRHEMFGWSRVGDKAQAPFDLDEARVGFDTLVHRSQLLRSDMMASARLPEAQPEVDRMYAFPEELRAIWGNLEIYLRRIFTESGLVERLAFRGLYLTSGLQSGVPIARVCTALIGESGQADARTLEGLFTKQRAYFIKDLVRNRVFGERGLVRPTARRVVRAQRSAWIGYGMSAVIAAVALIFAIVHFAKSKPPVDDSIDGRACAAAAHITDRSLEIPEILAELAPVVAAIERPEDTAVDTAFTDRKGAFQDLYGALVDRRLIARLRLRAEDEFARRLMIMRPSDYADVLRRVEHTKALLSDIDLRKPEQRGHLLDLVPSDEQKSTDERRPRNVAEALELREHNGPSSIVSSPRPRTKGSGLDSVVDAMTVTWDSVLVPGSGCGPGGQVGYVLAWMGLYRNYDRLVKWRASESGVHPFAEGYGNSLATLITAGTDLKEVSQITIKSELGNLRDARDDFLAVTKDHGSHVDSAWEAHKGELDRFVTDTMQVPASGPKPTKEIDTALRKYRNDAFKAVCAVEFLPLVPLDLATLQQQLHDGYAQFVTGGKSPEVTAIFKAKCLDVGANFRKSYTDWSSVAKLANAKPDSEEPLQTGVVRTMLAMRDDLLQLDDGTGLYADWIDAVEGRLIEHFAEVEQSLPPTRAVADVELEVLTCLVDASKRASARSQRLRSASDSLRSHYLGRMSEMWSKDPENIDRTRKIFRELLPYLRQLQQAFPGDNSVDSAWIASVDGLVAAGLKRHIEDLEQVWKVQTPADWSTRDLPSAAQWALDQLSLQNLQARRQKQSETHIEVGAGDFPDDKDPMLGRLSATKAALESLRTLLERSSAENIKAGKLAESVVQLPQTIAKKPEMTQNGTLLATELWAWRDACAKEGASGTGGGAVFVSAVRDAFDLRVLDELRRRYLERMHSEVIRNYTTVMKAIRADDDKGLVDVGNDLLLSELNQLCAQKGTLDKLKKDFAIDVEKHREVRPSGAARVAEWELDEFLFGLQDFLLGNQDRVAEVTDSKLALSITPKPGASGSLWGSSARKYALIETDTHTDEIPSSPPAEKKVEWPLAGANRKFELRWSKSLDESHHSGDVEYSIPTCLAPLYLAWWNGKLEGEVWRLTPGPYEVDGKTLSADCELRFNGRKLPPRPQHWP
jgi:hypothetical protein